MSGRPLIAVLGCPNTGKSTVFNRLTGLRQKTGNYPGVTVERITGVARLEQREVALVDLPGTYSLAADGPESGITLDVVLGMAKGLPRPNALLLVVDATNLRRSLFLFSQARELGLPLAVALNMQDVAKRRGLKIDSSGLSRQLKVPVTAMTANRGKGLVRLRSALEEILVDPAPAQSLVMPEIRAAAESLHRRLEGFSTAIPSLERAIIDKGGEFERRLVAEGGQEALAALDGARRDARRANAGSSLQTREARRAL